MNWVAKKKTIAGGALLSLLAFPQFAFAEPVTKQQEFMPGKSYVVFQLDPITDEASGKPVQRAHAVLARYDAEAGDIRGRGKAAGKSVPADQVVRVQAFKKKLIKQGKRLLYLIEVEPDIWTIESAGIGMSGALADMTTSFSLGSYTFEVGEGQVVDLGVLVPVRPKSDNPDTKLTTGKVLKGLFLLGGMKIEQVPLTMEIRERRADDIPLPAWLASQELSKVELTYGNRFGNYAGGLINRIDGVKGRARPAEANAKANAKAEVEAEVAASSDRADVPTATAADVEAVETQG